MQVGDNIICIENKNHNLQLTIGRSYVIRRLTEERVYIRDNSYLERGWFYSKFVPELEYYRRLKIIKIKNRCINLVIG